MERPTLVHFLAIKTNEYIHIKSFITLRKVTQKEQLHGVAISSSHDLGAERKNLRSPIQAIKLLTGDRFKVKIIGLDSKKKNVIQKVFESDSFGGLNVRMNTEDLDIQVLQVYEVSHIDDIDLLLGNFIPLTIDDPRKIIICDFDKTLVDTKYSTTKEVYHSLTRPMDYFPTVVESVEILKNHITKGFHPFFEIFSSISHTFR